MRRTTGILAVGLLLCFFVPTAAPQLTWKEIGPAPDRILPPTTMRVSMDILMDGQPIRTIVHQGRVYLPLPYYGAEYQIRVNNHGPRRITAIVSVDGLSVFHGRPASENHPGYIVEPNSHLVIPGWRRDMNTVAAFTFTEREKSYAYRLGYPDNVGVIGLVAFEEMTRPPRPWMEWRESPTPGLRSPKSDLGGSGTGWGRDIDSRIQYVPFVRSNNKRTVTIYYDTEENLRRAGVPVDRRYPLPFPMEPEFCPPPKG